MGHGLWRVRRIVGAAMVVGGLTACAGPVGGDSTGRYITNDLRTWLTPDANAALAKSWTNDPRAVFGDRRVGSRDPLWVIDFIALTESRGPQPCTRLRAIELRRLELRPVAGMQSHTGKTVTYSPREYHEIWVVEACGVTREWRLLDDPNDPGNPLTVLLFRTRPRAPG